MSLSQMKCMLVMIFNTLHNLTCHFKFKNWQKTRMISDTKCRIDLIDGFKVSGESQSILIMSQMSGKRRRNKKKFASEMLMLP